MKTNRSLIHPLLALLMVLSLLLCACGKETPDPSGSITPNSQPSSTPDNTEPGSSEPASTDPVMSIGRIEGGVYTNRYVGFTMALGSDWTYYSAEELQELPENVADLFEGSELGDAINTIEYFQDMMAENVSNMTTVNLLYQKMDMKTRLFYATLTEAQIVDTVLAESDKLISSYAQAGIMVDSIQSATVTFLGKPRTAVKTVATVNDVPYYILQIYEYHLGQYSATITFGSFVEDKTESLLALCQSLS